MGARHFFFELDLRDDDLLDADFLVVDFFDEDFFALDFFELDFFEEDFFDGTLPPSRRASDRPMAMACLRLFTFFPELPLFNVPRLRSCIAFSTLSDAFFPYFFDAICSSPFACSESCASGEPVDR
jgi:hypothetical protein